VREVEIGVTFCRLAGTCKWNGWRDVAFYLLPSLSAGGMMLSFNTADLQPIALRENVFLVH
jgi:hypothetical protein